jgi:hypothetical protein
MRRAIIVATCIAAGSACGGNGRNSGSADQSGVSGAAALGSMTGGTGGAPSSAGDSASGAGDPAAGNGGAGSSGAAGLSGSTSSGGSPLLMPATGTPGVWEEVTPANADPALFTGPSGFGMGSIVTDPARPTDLYVGGYGSIWKSTDYGLTWSKLNSNPNPPYLPLGHVLAVAGTTPATLWMANVNGAQHVFKSTDGGLNFMLTGAIPEQPDAASLYSIVVDPNDPTHLITGLHEQDKVLESTDGGATWKFVSGGGWPAGGKSWFPFFINTGDAVTTSKTWFAIAQDGASATMTSDAGQTWATPKGIEGLKHPHGDTGFYQSGKTLVAIGIGATSGDGVYRSTDLGVNWTRIAQGSGGVVWGSAKNLYAMWGWACASCGLKEGGPVYQTSPQPGDQWAMGSVPDGLTWGPNSVATTSDGTHAIFVGSMWATGLWRYVEP